MGFMDKAKQLAEQAQQKLEETQKQFNQNQAAKSSQGEQAQGVRYDEHGRPQTSGPQTPDPGPQEEAPGPRPQAPEAEGSADVPPDEAMNVADRAAEPPADGDANDNPDPFKPIE